MEHQEEFDHIFREYYAQLFVFARRFIDDIDDPKSRTILKHTVTMLNELNLDTIVEGVENEKQKNFLLECGCTRAQGYFYYKPMPVQKFEELLDAGK